MTLFERMSIAAILASSLTTVVGVAVSFAGVIKPAVIEPEVFTIEWCIDNGGFVTIDKDNVLHCTFENIGKIEL